MKITLNLTIDRDDFDTIRRALELASDRYADTAADHDERDAIERLADAASDLHTRLTHAMPSSY
jgi:hypothetical protein